MGILGLGQCEDQVGNIQVKMMRILTKLGSRENDAYEGESKDL